MPQSVMHSEAKSSADQKSWIFLRPDMRPNHLPATPPRDPSSNKKKRSSSRRARCRVPNCPKQSQGGRNDHMCRAHYIQYRTQTTCIGGDGHEQQEGKYDDPSTEDEYSDSDDGEEPTISTESLQSDHVQMYYHSDLEDSIGMPDEPQTTPGAESEVLIGGKDAVVQVERIQKKQVTPEQDSTAGGESEVTKGDTVQVKRTQKKQVTPEQVLTPLALSAASTGLVGKRTHGISVHHAEESWMRLYEVVRPVKTVGVNAWAAMERQVKPEVDGNDELRSELLSIADGSPSPTPFDSLVQSPFPSNEANDSAVEMNGPSSNFWVDLNRQVRQVRARRERKGKTKGGNVSTDHLGILKTKTDNVQAGTEAPLMPHLSDLYSTSNPSGEERAASAGSFDTNNEARSTGTGVGRLPPRKSAKPSEGDPFLNVVERIAASEMSSIDDMIEGLINSPSASRKVNVEDETVSTKRKLSQEEMGRPVKKCKTNRDPWELKDIDGLGDVTLTPTYVPADKSSAYQSPDRLSITPLPTRQVSPSRRGDTISALSDWGKGEDLVGVSAEIGPCIAANTCTGPMIEGRFETKCKGKTIQSEIGDSDTTTQGCDIDLKGIKRPASSTALVPGGKAAHDDASSPLHNFVGKYIVKEFPDGNKYRGEVVYFDLKEKLLTVLYDDHDWEELTEEEAKACQLLVFNESTGTMKNYLSPVSETILLCQNASLTFPRHSMPSEAMPWVRRLPFIAQHELWRLLNTESTSRIGTDQLESARSYFERNPNLDAFSACKFLYRIASIDNPLIDYAAIFEIHGSSFDSIPLTLNAILERGSLKLELLPPSDDSVDCRAFRRFGPGRFLRVYIHDDMVRSHLENVILAHNPIYIAGRFYRFAWANLEASSNYLLLFAESGAGIHPRRSTSSARRGINEEISVDFVRQWCTSLASNPRVTLVEEQMCLSLCFTPSTESGALPANSLSITCDNESENTHNIDIRSDGGYGRVSRAALDFIWSSYCKKESPTDSESKHKTINSDEECNREMKDGSNDTLSSPACPFSSFHGMIGGMRGFWVLDPESGEGVKIVCARSQELFTVPMKALQGSAKNTDDATVEDSYDTVEVFEWDTLEIEDAFFSVPLIQILEHLGVPLSAFQKYVGDGANLVEKIKGMSDAEVKREITKALHQRLASQPAERCKQLRLILDHTDLLKPGEAYIVLPSDAEMKSVKESRHLLVTTTSPSFEDDVAKFNIVSLEALNDRASSRGCSGVRFFSNLKTGIVIASKKQNPFNLFQGNQLRKTWVCWDDDIVCRVGKVADCSGKAAPDRSARLEGTCTLEASEIMPRDRYIYVMERLEQNDRRRRLEKFLPVLNDVFGMTNKQTMCIANDLFMLSNYRQHIHKPETYGIKWKAVQYPNWYQHSTDSNRRYKSEKVLGELWLHLRDTLEAARNVSASGNGASAPRTLPTSTNIHRGTGHPPQAKLSLPDDSASKQSSCRSMSKRVGRRRGGTKSKPAVNTGR